MIDILIIIYILVCVQPKEPVLGWQEIVKSHVDSLRFGMVQIVVHDSRVVQIERTERVRLAHTGPNPAVTYPALQTSGGHL